MLLQAKALWENRSLIAQFAPNEQLCSLRVSANFHCKSFLFPRKLSHLIQSFGSELVRYGVNHNLLGFQNVLFSLRCNALVVRCAVTGYGACGGRCYDYLRDYFEDNSVSATFASWSLC